jgi:hypothetical protein
MVNITYNFLFTNYTINFLLLMHIFMVSFTKAVYNSYRGTACNENVCESAPSIFKFIIVTIENHLNFLIVLVSNSNLTLFFLVIGFIYFSLLDYIWVTILFQHDRYESLQSIWTQSTFLCNSQFRWFMWFIRNSYTK